MNGAKKVQSVNLLGVQKNIFGDIYQWNIDRCKYKYANQWEQNYQILLSVIKYPSAVLLKKIVVPWIM